MTYGASLLRAILDDPGSDVARLAYADHLEETGEGARAEFIRVQVELAKRDDREPHCNRYVDRQYCSCAECVCYRANASRTYRLRCRERELTEMPLAQWTKCCAPLVGGPGLPTWAWTCRRGFVNSIATTATDFLAHAAALFAAQPITEVRLTDREPWSNATFADWSYPCGWQESMTWWLREPYRLPPPLWETMKAPFVRDDIGYPDRVKCFPDLATAHAALSRACVAYGRELVGLPPLSEETKR